jgi:hypothetical protein
MASHTTSNKKVKRTVQLQIGRHSVMEPCTEPVNVDTSDVDDEQAAVNVFDPSDPKMKYHFSKYPAFGNIGRSELSFQISDILEKKCFNDCFSLIPTKKPESNSKLLYDYYNLYNRLKLYYS